MIQGTVSVVIALLFSLVGIGFVFWQMRRVLAEDQGNLAMREISQAVQVGASAFLRLDTPIWPSLWRWLVWWWRPSSTGRRRSTLSWAQRSPPPWLSGHVRCGAPANVRTAAAAARSLNDGLRVAFGSGFGDGHGGRELWPAGGASCISSSPVATW